MAYFGPIPGSPPIAWDPDAGQLGMTVGRYTEIGIHGAGTYGGNGPLDLNVYSRDPSIVTVHEPPGSNTPGWRRLTLLALRQGTAEIIATMPTGAQIVTSMSVEASGIGGLKLVFFPGEQTKEDALVGTIYVVGGKGERFAAAGGPRDRSREGGHYVTPTPPGIYTLGPQHRHTTTGWPNSVIAFGTPLRIGSNGEVEYAIDRAKTRWRVATGRNGTVTKAMLIHLQAQNLRQPLADTLQDVRDIFIKRSTGQLRSQVYYLNDFGRWSWNLRRNGVPTSFYIHTTAENEEETMSNKAVSLANSHGCVHVVPSERDQMVSSGYLKEGVTFEVRPYGEQGFP